MKLKTLIGLLVLFLSISAYAEVSIFDDYQRDLDFLLSKPVDDQGRSQFRSKWIKKFETLLLSKGLSKELTYKTYEALIALSSSNGDTKKARAYNKLILAVAPTSEEGLYWGINYAELGFLGLDAKKGQDDYKRQIRELILDYEQVVPLLQKAENFKGLESRLPSFFHDYLQLLVATGKFKETGILSNEVLALYSQQKLTSENTQIKTFDFQLMLLRSLLETGQSEKAVGLIFGLITHKSTEIENLKTQAVLGEYLMSPSSQEAAVKPILLGVYQNKLVWKTLIPSTRLIIAKRFMEEKEITISSKILVSLFSELPDGDVVKGQALLGLKEIFDNLGKDAESEKIRALLTKKYPDLISKQK